MQVHFVRSNKPGSKLIRALTGESVSHVALELDSLGVVVHATMGGVDLDSVEHFRAACEIVITLRYTGTADTRLWETRALMAEGSGYDLLLLLRLGMKFLLKKSFGLVWPFLDTWASKNKYICTEFVESVIGFSAPMEMTPGQLGDKLIDTGSWKLIRK